MPCHYITLHHERDEVDPRERLLVRERAHDARGPRVERHRLRQQQQQQQQRDHRVRQTALAMAMAMAMAMRCTALHCTAMEWQCNAMQYTSVPPQQHLEQRDHVMRYDVM